VGKYGLANHGRTKTPPVSVPDAYNSTIGDREQILLFLNAGQRGGYAIGGQRTG
jgi:hypothetical protein